MRKLIYGMNGTLGRGEKTPRKQVHWLTLPRPGRVGGA